MDNFEKYCRLCATEQEASIMIFGPETASMQLQSKLNKYLLIEVGEDDQLPKSICTRCCRQLHNVCEFIDKTQKAQEILLQHSLFYEQLKSITDTTNSRIPQITNITFQGSDDHIQTANLHNEVISDFAEITYLSCPDGENVTITRNTNDPSLTFHEQKIKELEDKPFACNLCNRKFLSDIALKNHTWSHISINEEKPLICTICNIVFAFKKDFLKHFKERKHSRYCPTCKRTFRTDKNLKLHMEIHSSNRNFFTCNECGRSYSNKSSFKYHIVSHSEERPHQCTICKMKFKRPQELRFHLNKHNGVKPFKCPNCDKCFTRSTNCYNHKIKMHPVTQNNEVNKTSITITHNQPATPKTSMTVKNPSKYKCHLCSHTFLKKENFTYHMYKHTGIKPFHCIHCDDKFVTRRGMYLHYENVHPGKDRPLALLSKNTQLNH